MKKRSLTNPFITIATLFFSIFIHTSAKCQRSNNRQVTESNFFSEVSVSDTSHAETETSDELNYLLFDVSYTNNHQLNKKSDSLKVSSIFADFSFYHCSGLFVSFLPSEYLTTSAFTYDIDVAIGFQKSFDIGIDLSSQYLYHYFKGDTMLRGINYKHSFSLSGSFLYKGLFFGIDANSYFGISNNFYITSSNGYYIDFDDCLFKDDFFTFFPNISATFSTDYWLYDNLGPLGDKFLERYISYQGFPTKTISLQSFDFMVPITYSYGNFTLSGSYMYTIPADKYKMLKWEEQSSFMFSISYLLNL